MPGDSSIEWTERTWNPVTGCSKVSPGCAHCYAEREAMGRLRGKPGYPGLPWTPGNAVENVVLHRDRLDQPLRWRKPCVIFVNSMSDLFHPRLTGLPDEDPRGTEYPPVMGEPPRPDFLADVFAVMSLAERHVFQVLTKRPKAARLLLGHANFWLQVNAARMSMGREVIPGGMSDLAQGRQVLPNVWLGTSVESNRYADRAKWIRAAPAAVRFVSAEPLLGPVDQLELRAPAQAPPPATESVDEAIARAWRPEPQLPPLDWVIAGGESGPRHRPFDLAWARDLRDRCAAEGVAFFMKQVGGHRPGSKLADLPEDLRVRQMPAGLPAADEQLELGRA